jgi:hypothetical protein
VDKLGVPHFESVATTGIGVEETLKGITKLVLSHLVKKYGLEGSEPLEREIQILNPTSPAEPRPHDSLWDDEDFFGEVTPVKAPASSSFVLDDADDADDLPMVPTELIAPKTAPPNPVTISVEPFEFDYYATKPEAGVRQPSSGMSVIGSGSAPSALEPLPHEVPMMSIEIPLPEGILNSLPDLGAPGTGVAAPAKPTERRATDGLVKEVTVPLNISLEELRQHRRLRLKITLDVNLLS